MKLRIASYNIRKAVGLDWRRDPQRIVQVLAEIDADIVVLQEADRRMGARAGVLPLDHLRDNLDLILPDVAIRPLSHGWHGNCILVKSRFANPAAQRLDLPMLEPRGAVSVTLQDPRLQIIGAHLGLTPAMRRKQMRALQDQMSQCAHRVVLAGDLNEWNAARLPFDAPYRVISPGLSFHAARPSGALDRFVLGPGLETAKSWVHTSPLAKRASDHLPIVMDLKLLESPE